MSDYVNGREFCDELKIYHASYLRSVELGEEKPQISDTISRAIIQICTRLSNSFNFINYTYKDEMIADAILKCYTKVHRFDPAISENAFAFFTQCAYNAYIHRIKIEQKESSIKAKTIREKLSSEFVAHGVDSDSDDGTNSFVEFLKENDAYIDYIEKSREVFVADSLKHRNKTAYVKKEKVAIDNSIFDLSEFEN